MTHQLKNLLAVLALSALGGCMGTNRQLEDKAAAATVSADPADESMCMVPADAAQMREQVLDEINDLRESAGLDPLAEDESLSAAADDFACRMLEQDFFAHQDPETGDGPGDRLIDAGYIFYTMGENLAAGQQSVDEVVNDWLKSPAHRANILSPEWRETGIAVRSGGSYGWYWVEEFAEPIDLDVQ